MIISNNHKKPYGRVAPGFINSVAQLYHQGPMSFSSFCSTKLLHGHKMATAVPGITSRPNSTQQKRRQCFLYFSYFPRIPPPSADFPFCLMVQNLLHMAISIPIPSKGNRVTVVGLGEDHDCRAPWRTLNKMRCYE